MAAVSVSSSSAYMLVKAAADHAVDVWLEAWNVMAKWQSN